MASTSCSSAGWQASPEARRTPPSTSTSPTTAADKPRAYGQGAARVRRDPPRSTSRPPIRARRRDANERGELHVRHTVRSARILADPADAPAYATRRNESSEELLIEGVRIRVASLDHVIAMKEASGRPRDLLMASEYRVISDELRRPRDDETH